jgi:hypothetical protein
MNATTTQSPKSEGKLSNSVKLARAAWRVVKLDKELLGVGAISLVANLLIFAAYLYVAYFVVPNFISVDFSNLSDFTSNVVWYVMVALYLFTSYAVTNFFSGAISFAAFRRFDGNDPTFAEAMRAAKSKASPLLAYSGIQATVGLILNMIADRVPFAGKIAVWLAGASWSVATMFSVPVIMNGDERNPILVIRKSAKTFTGIWKESVFIGLSLGIISIVATILSMFVIVGLIALAITFESNTLAVIALEVLVVVTLTISLIMNTLQAIAMTAAYYYATTNQLPAGFDGELIRSMFRPKKKWLTR